MKLRIPMPINRWVMKPVPENARPLSFLPTMVDRSEKDQVAKAHGFILPLLIRIQTPSLSVV
jgi:hypothetical protein